jgi:hypothetical protein
MCLKTIFKRVEMVKKSKDFTPARYKTFKMVQELLKTYGTEMIVEVSQQESLYLTFPQKNEYREKAGGLFAALQIRENAVDFYLSILMDYPGWCLRRSSKKLVGAVDQKGVMHLFHISATFYRELEELIKAAAMMKNLGDMGELVSRESMQERIQ